MRRTLAFGIITLLMISVGLGMNLAYDSGGGGGSLNTTDSGWSDTSTSNTDDTTDSTDSTTDTTSTSSASSTDTTDSTSTSDGGWSDTSTTNNDDGSTDTSTSTDNNDDSWTNTTTDNNDDGSTDSSTSTDNNDDSWTNTTTDNNNDNTTDSTGDGGTTTDGTDSTDGADGGNGGTGTEDTNEEPSASISYSPTSPKTGESVSFDGSGSSDPDGSITSYEWDLDGDGSFEASGSSASKTYSNPGSYTVELRVTDNDGATDTASTTVNVQAKETDGGDEDGDGGTQKVSASDGGGSFRPLRVVITDNEERSLSLNIESDTVEAGQPIGISGVLKGVSKDSIDLYVNGEFKRKIDMRTDMFYNTTVTFNEPGEKHLEVRRDDLSAKDSVTVIPRTDETTLRIKDIYSSKIVRTGEPFELCANTEATSPPEISVYRNGDLMQRKTGELSCFRLTVNEPGETHFDVKARLDGKTVNGEQSVMVLPHEAPQKAGLLALLMSILASSWKIVLSMVTGLGITAGVLRREWATFGIRATEP